MLETRVREFELRSDMPSGAAASSVRLDQAVQAGPACFDKEVQTGGSMPLHDWMDLWVGEEERRLDDSVEEAGSPVASTGTVATIDAVDTPPDVVRHPPVLRRATSCPELQLKSPVSCPGVPRRPVSGASASSSPVPRSPVRASPPPTPPRPCVPVADSAAAELEWTPSAGGRMPLLERDRRMRQGRCLYCAEKGHFLIDCPIRPSFSKYGQL